jgi:transitional endoplasmic reticulum ATPase
VAVSDVTWSDVGGLHEAKRRLHETVLQPLRHPESFEAMGLHAPIGVLLAGRPGTGKTLLARALASASGANFIPLAGPELFSKWLGETEAAIRQVFVTARQVAPSIVFIDQIDAVAATRSSDTGSRTAERVVNQLLAEMDDLEPRNRVVVLAATNRLDLLDPAVLRPGRFGVMIEIGLPDAGERREIALVHLREAPVEASTTAEALAEWVAEQTDGFSGADVQALCDEAKFVVLRSTAFQQARPLGLADFRAALERSAELR